MSTRRRLIGKDKSVFVDYITGTKTFVTPFLIPCEGFNFEMEHIVKINPFPIWKSIFTNDGTTIKKNCFALMLDNYGIDLYYPYGNGEYGRVKLSYNKSIVKVQQRKIIYNNKVVGDPQIQQFDSKYMLLLLDVIKVYNIKWEGIEYKPALVNNQYGFLGNNGDFITDEDFIGGYDNE